MGLRVGFVVQNSHIDHWGKEELRDSRIEKGLVDCRFRITYSSRVEGGFDTFCWKYDKALHKAIDRNVELRSTLEGGILRTFKALFRDELYTFYWDIDNKVTQLVTPDPWNNYRTKFRFN